MSLRFGINAKLYRNTGAYTAPSWVEVPNVSDGKLSLSKSEADATTRGTGGVKATAGVLKEVEFGFQMKAAEGDDDVARFWDAYWSNDLLDLAVFETESSDESPRGVHAMWEVMSLERGEENEGIVTYDVTIKPGYAPTKKPETIGDD